MVNTPLFLLEPLGPATCLFTVSSILLGEPITTVVLGLVEISPFPKGHIGSIYPFAVAIFGSTDPRCLVDSSQ